MAILLDRFLMRLHFDQCGDGVTVDFGILGVYAWKLLESVAH